MVDQPRDSLGKFLPFDDLNNEAEQLNKSVVELNGNMGDLRKTTVAAGTAGASAFKSQADQSKVLGLSLGSVTKAFQTQFALSKLLRAGYRDMKQGLEALVDGAISFGREQESAFDPKNVNQLVRGLRQSTASLLGIAGSGVFQSFRGLLQSLTTFTESDTVVAAVAAIDDGIASAIDGGRRFIETIRPDDLLEIANTIGSVIRGAADVIGPVLSGIVSGLGDLSKLARSIFGQGFGDEFKKTAEALARISTIVLGLAIPLAAVAALFTGFAGPILLALGALVGLDAGAKKLGFSLGFVRDVIANGLVFGFEAFLQRIESSKLAAQGLFALFTEGPGAAAKFAAEFSRSEEKVRALGAELQKLNDEAAAKPAKGLKELVDESLDAIRGFISKDLPDLASKSRERAAQGEKSFAEQLFFGEGGLANFLVSAESGVLQAAELVKGAFNSTASFISNAIVDAFDPNNKKDLQQRFGAFLQGLARMILESTIKRALASVIDAAISGISGLSGAGGLAGGLRAVGKALGGEVPSVGAPSLGHVFARGYASGGLAASDTVPAWLTPGEWVMRLGAVRKYGAGFMDLLNRGALDPGMIRSLAGRGSSRAASGPGYAGGGLVADRQSSSERGKDLVVLPAIPANDQTMSQLLNGGQAAFWRFLEENASRGRSAMGVSGAHA